MSKPPIAGRMVFLSGISRINNICHHPSWVYQYEEIQAAWCAECRSANMMISVTVNAIYECSLERAFKTPMLCDVSKVHTGFGIMPKVTHTSGDANWGKPGSSKKVYAAKSLTQKGGFVSVDTILERHENQYWKFRVDDFQSWMLGFNKFVGEWKTTPLAADKTAITYTYQLYAATPWLYPLNWLFTKFFWKAYMRQVLENVRKLTYSKAPYLYP